MAQASKNILTKAEQTLKLLKAGAMSGSDKILSNLIEDLIANQEYLLDQEKKNQQQIQSGVEEISAQSEELHAQNEELISQNNQIFEHYENLTKLNAKVIYEKEIAQQYLDIAGVIMISLDVNGIVTLANKKALEVLGATSAEVIGHDWFENFIQPNQIATMKEVFLTLFKDEQTALSVFENTIITKNGEERLVHWKNSIVKNEDGVISGILSSGEDITEQQKLLSQLTMVNLAIDNSLNAFDVVDANGHFTYVNKSYVKMWGYNSAEEIIGTSANGHCIDPSLPIKIISNVEKYGQYIVEFKAKRKDGSSFDVLMHIRRSIDQVGNITYPSSSIDITEQKRAQQIIKDSEEQFRSLFENAGDGIIVHNEEGQIVNVNQKICELFEYSKEEFCKLHIFDTRVPGSVDALNSKKSFDQLNKKGSTSFESEFVTKSGKIIYGAVTANQIKTGTTTVNHSIFRDITTQKAEQDKLKANETRLKALFDGSPAAIYETDALGKCLMVNKIWREFAGMNTEEALGDGWINAIHPDDRNYIAEQWTNHALSGKNWNTEYRFVSKDNTVTWVWGVASALYDDDGSITGFIGINTDITARKLAEADLKEVETRLGHIYEYSPLAIAMLDLEGSPLLVSPAFSKILGYSEKDLLAKSLAEITHPDDVETNTALFQEIIDEKRDYYQVEKRAITKNGEVRHLNVYVVAVKDNDNKLNQLFLLAEDVTNRRHAEMALSESEEKFRSLASNLPNIAFTADLDYKITYINKSLPPLNPDDVIGQDLFNFIEKDQAERVENFLSHIRVNKQAVAYETESANRFDSRWLDVRLGPILNGDKLTGYIFVLTDITLRKQIEQELLAHQTKLEQLVQERTKELENKNMELERFNKLFIGREFRINELRGKVKSLEEQIKSQN